MASVVKVYQVRYHFEQGGKKSSMDYVDFVQAASDDYTTLKNVLSSNGRIRVGTFVIDNVHEIGHAENCLA